MSFLGSKIKKTSNPEKSLTTPHAQKGKNPLFSIIQKKLRYCYSWHLWIASVDFVLV